MDARLPQNHFPAMREPCGYHANRHPHDSYSNGAQINVPAKKSFVVVNVALSDRERRIASQATMYNAYNVTYRRELEYKWHVGSGS